MDSLITALRAEITKLSNEPSFVHHEWFITYHLAIVEKIALELLEKYPHADRDLTLALVWMHDYGKLVDFTNQHATSLSAGAAFMQSLGFDEAFAQKVIDYIAILDAKENLETAPIEVQIVSSADGASHFVGPFFSVYWQERADLPFPNLLAENKRKADVDFNTKIVLPEVVEAFREHFRFAQIFNDAIPEKFLI